MNSLLNTVADIAPFPGGNHPYNPSQPVSSSDHTLLIIVIALAAVSIVSNVVLAVLLVRAKHARRPQANLQDMSDDVTRSVA